MSVSAIAVAGAARAVGAAMCAPAFTMIPWRFRMAFAAAAGEDPHPLRDHGVRPPAAQAGDFQESPGRQGLHRGDGRDVRADQEGRDDLEQRGDDAVPHPGR